MFIGSVVLLKSRGRFTLLESFEAADNLEAVLWRVRAAKSKLIAHGDYAVVAEVDLEEF